MPRQYVACKFRPEDRSGDGTKRVHVVAIHFDEPGFPTKPIVGKVEPEPAEQPDLIARGDDADLEAHLENRA